jgi:hypothetical protein
MNLDKYLAEAFVVPNAEARGLEVAADGAEGALEGAQ